MIGMILAAGFGTRLEVLSETLPKPLVPVAGRPMIAHVVDRLRDVGCSRLVVNVHHHADQLCRYFDDNDFGLPVTISREPAILGTGGGILHAASHLAGAEPVLVHNADIASDINLMRLVEVARTHAVAAVLAVHPRQTSRPLLFTDEMHLVGKESWFPRNPATLGSRYGFCGIHVLMPRMWNVSMSDPVFDVFDWYRCALELGETILGVSDAKYWTDLGTPERLRQHERHLTVQGA